ncbi:RluA family pseudouridine synthase [Rubritalea marina]|uniref:RluA family pseudouridine synthase n=1 Tax=Rubritalea marina TaxID=361055 RepID=UPI000381B761|nr:RluA family pseudouridine synthase [Rubritalea marina]
MEIVADTTGARLDIFLNEKIDDMSRAQIQTLIKSGNVTVNGKACKAKYSVQHNDTIAVDIPEPENEEVAAEDIPVEILFEDEHLIVLNKATGMVVHPAAGNNSGTLVNALLHHCHGKLAAEGGEGRPGIVHRLDKDTSGCIVVAKSDTAHRSLVAQFKERSTKKQYLAVVNGTPLKENDTVFTHIGRHPVNRLKMAVVNPGSGKTAITDYQCLGHDDLTDSSLIHCDLHTGRTHQIRVHMLHIGCAILDDPIYAKVKHQKTSTGRLMLHARRLSITHPVTEERLTFRAPIPEEFHPWTDRFYTDPVEA